jgi:hypothetical protein
MMRLFVAFVVFLETIRPLFDGGIDVLVIGREQVESSIASLVPTFSIALTHAAPQSFVHIPESLFRHT